MVRPVHGGAEGNSLVTAIHSTHSTGHLLTLASKAHPGQAPAQLSVLFLPGAQGLSLVPAPTGQAVAAATSPCIRALLLHLGLHICVLETQGGLVGQQDLTSAPWKPLEASLEARPLAASACSLFQISQGGKHCQGSPSSSVDGLGGQPAGCCRLWVWPMPQHTASSCLQGRQFPRELSGQQESQAVPCRSWAGTGLLQPHTVAPSGHWGPAEPPLLSCMHLHHMVGPGSHREAVGGPSAG